MGFFKLLHCEDFCECRPKINPFNCSKTLFIGKLLAINPVRYFLDLSECSIIGSHEFMFFSVLKHFYFLFFKSRSPLFSLAKSETNFSFSLSAKKSSLSEIKKMTQDSMTNSFIWRWDKGPLRRMIWFEWSILRVNRGQTSNIGVGVKRTEWSVTCSIRVWSFKFKKRCTCRISSSRTRFWTWRRSSIKNIFEEIEQSLTNTDTHGDICPVKTVTADDLQTSMVHRTLKLRGSKILTRHDLWVIIYWVIDYWVINYLLARMSFLVNLQLNHVMLSSVKLHDVFPKIPYWSLVQHSY